MQHWIYNRIRFLCCIQGRMMPYIVMIWIFQRAATVRKKKDIPSWINQSPKSSSKQKSFPNIEKKCDVNHLPAVVTMLIIETNKIDFEAIRGIRFSNPSVGTSHLNWKKKSERKYGDHLFWKCKFMFISKYCLGSFRWRTTANMVRIKVWSTIFGKTILSI